MTMSIAFFVSPEGRLIPVSDSHISTVIADPEGFGLTRQEIDATYLHHEEKVGVEGAARRELLLRLISQGWIRIRRYRNYWSVTAPSLTPAIQQRLQSWAFKMLTGTNGFRETDRYMPVKILVPEGEIVFTLRDLADAICPW